MANFEKYLIEAFNVGYAGIAWRKHQKELVQAGWDQQQFIYKLRAESTLFGEMLNALIKITRNKEKLLTMEGGERLYNDAAEKKREWLNKGLLPHVFNKRWHTPGKDVFKIPSEKPAEDKSCNPAFSDVIGINTLINQRIESGYYETNR